MHENELKFHRKIIMSNEAHFQKTRVFLMSQNETSNWKTLYFSIGLEFFLHLCFVELKTLHGKKLILVYFEVRLSRFAARIF